MRLLSILSILPLLALGPIGHAARVGGTAVSPSFSPSPFVPPPVGGLRGTAPGGELYALMGQTVETNAQDKIVLRITGHGSLALTAIGPDGRSLTPNSLQPHTLGSSWDGIVPGDEWGSGWVFPIPGCWHLHAVRDDIAGDVYFEAVVPELRDMAFTLASPRPGPIRSGQKIVFLVRPDIEPGTNQSVAGRITIRHAGKSYRVLRLQGSGSDAVRASTRLRVRTSTWFTAGARLTFRDTTLTRSIRFRVTSAHSARSAA